jgi:hypothetical protein
MKALIKMLFILVVCVLILALVFTIIGSSTGHDGLLATGIIMWLAASCLLFACMVLAIWTRRKRYEG